MNIVCVAACMAGIAHTYIVREKLTKGAKALGHNIKVETQGTIGAENELLTGDIVVADVVILAVDARIKGEERFSNKRIVRVKTETVIKSSIQFLEKVEESLISNNRQRSSFWRGFTQVKTEFRYLRK